MEEKTDIFSVSVQDTTTFAIVTAVETNLFYSCTGVKKISQESAGFLTGCHNVFIKDEKKC